MLDLKGISDKLYYMPEKKTQDVNKAYKPIYHQLS